MSIVAIVLVALGAAVLLALAIIALALFSPVVLSVNSETGQVRVRWFAALEYRRPLPWAKGETAFSMVGKRVALSQSRAAREPERETVARKPRKNRARIARFLRRCLGDPTIRSSVARRFAKLARGIWRSVSLTRREVSVSLPDPAWNGMLAGWLAQSDADSAFRIDFTGENSAYFEARMYPYRIVGALLAFVFGLPYPALVRAWRASSAAASG